MAGREGTWLSWLGRTETNYCARTLLQVPSPVTFEDSESFLGCGLLHT